ncbi:MarR family winged helix-turn-helix transcriptional regulator [Pediococcus claussenii]|uniref:HTH marR-type domain-containing protein n=1 Tax=Pediococcus claussenii (strain ATCC BAA-344 / DSM 14800 / JCM 18046 / KCTC 3811 / LMG 21948 / P06) TaxID=701521 RepID=G8PAH6_PEDCP|nr:MarR family transcriptional regulator [Pediococcus claussenii]AEV95765.1 hypothetical protein PECL_1547 [Pediococcus claussenii ATCC BAA-344]ANZ69273.1 hypothetical protein AYR57_02680 [Pediococcus claussenii]ANZ71092.1 hypothetical protein AYR58_02695 [Pediococcus claussenii]KRN20376.1 hypothetical protein IV79_GL000429 [Pediococcus claussenii]
MNDMQYTEIYNLLKRINRDTQINRLSEFIGGRINDNVLTHLQDRLTHNDLDILSTIGKDELTVSEVVDQMAISQGGTSRRINHLERLDLLSKFHKAPNRKSVFLKLTTNGLILANAHNELHQALRQEAFESVSDFSDQDINTVIKFLKRLS